MDFDQLYQEAFNVKSQDVFLIRSFFHKDFLEKIQVLTDALGAGMCLEKKCSALFVIDRMLTGVDHIYSFLEKRPKPGTEPLQGGIEDKTSTLVTILIKYLVGIQQEHGIQSLTAGFFVMVHKASMLLSHYLWLVKVSSEDFIQAVGFLQEELAYSKSQGVGFDIHDLLRGLAALRRFLDSKSLKDRTRLEGLFILMMQMPNHPNFFDQFSAWEDYNHMAFMASGVRFENQDNKKHFFRALVGINLRACLFQIQKAINESPEKFLEVMFKICDLEVMSSRYSHVQSLLCLHLGCLKRRVKSEYFSTFIDKDIEQNILAIGPEDLYHSEFRALAQRVYGYFDESSELCLPLSRRYALSIQLNQFIEKFGQVYAPWFASMFDVLFKREMIDPYYLKMREYQTSGQSRITDHCWTRVGLLPTCPRFPEMDYIKIYLSETECADEYIVLLQKQLDNAEKIPQYVGYMIDVLLLSKSNILVSKGFIDLMQIISALFYSKMRQDSLFSVNELGALLAIYVMLPGSEAIEKTLHPFFIQGYLHHGYQPDMLFNQYPNFSYFYQPLDALDTMIALAETLPEANRLVLLERLQAETFENSWRGLLSEVLLCAVQVKNGILVDQDRFDRYLSLDVRMLSEDSRMLVLTERLILQMMNLYQSPVLQNCRQTFVKIFERLYVSTLWSRWHYEFSSHVSAQDLYQFMRISSQRHSGFLVNSALLGLAKQKIKLHDVLLKEQIKLLRQLAPKSSQIECYTGGLLQGSEADLSCQEVKGNYLTTLPFFYDVTKDTLEYVSNWVDPDFNHPPACAVDDEMIRWKVWQIMRGLHDLHQGSPFMGPNAVQAVLKEKDISRYSLVAFRLVIDQYQNLLQPLHESAVPNVKLRLLLALYAQGQLTLQDWHQYFLADDGPALHAAFDDLFQKKCPSGRRYWDCHPSLGRIDRKDTVCSLVLVIEDQQRLCLADVFTSRELKFVVDVVSDWPLAFGKIKLEQLWDAHVIKHRILRHAGMMLMIRIIRQLQRLPKFCSQGIGNDLFIQCDRVAICVYEKDQLKFQSVCEKECLEKLAVLLSHSQSKEAVAAYSYLMALIADDCAGVIEPFPFNSHPVYVAMGLEGAFHDAAVVKKELLALQKWCQSPGAKPKWSDQVVQMLLKSCDQVFSQRWGWLSHMAFSSVLMDYPWQDFQVKLTHNGCELVGKHHYQISDLRNEAAWKETFWHMTKWMKGEMPLHFKLSMELGICPGLDQLISLDKRWIGHIMQDTLLASKDQMDESTLKVLMQWIGLQYHQKQISAKQVAVFLTQQISNPLLLNREWFDVIAHEETQQWSVVSDPLVFNMVLTADRLPDQFSCLKTSLQERIERWHRAAEKKLRTWMDETFSGMEYACQWQGLDLILSCGALQVQVQATAFMAWTMVEQQHLSRQIREYWSEHHPMTLLSYSFKGHEEKFAIIAKLFEYLPSLCVSGELLWYYYFGLSIQQAPAKFHIYDFYGDKEQINRVQIYLKQQGFSCYEVRDGGLCANHPVLKIRLMFHHLPASGAERLGILSQMSPYHLSDTGEGLMIWDVIMQLRFAQLKGQAILPASLASWLGDWSVRDVVILCQRFDDAYMHLPDVLGVYLYQKFLQAMPNVIPLTIHDWLSLIKADMPIEKQGEFAQSMIEMLGYNDLTRRL